jgi:hypothetical protein
MRHLLGTEGLEREGWLGSMCQHYPWKKITLLACGSDLVRKELLSRDWTRVLPLMSTPVIP